MSPGMPADRGSSRSVTTEETTEYEEVIRDKREFVLSPADTPLRVSVSVVDRADILAPSCLLVRLAVAVAALRMLEEWGEVLLLEIDGGRSRASDLRCKTEDLRTRTRGTLVALVGGDGVGEGPGLS